MKKSKKIAGIIATTLLVFTAGTSLVSSNNQITTTVKADSYGRIYGEPDPNATEIKIDAPTLKFQKNAYLGLRSVAKWLPTVKVNHGKFDETSGQGQNFYKAKADGSVNLAWPLDWSYFTTGDKGKVVAYANLSGLQPYKKYTFLAQDHWYGKNGSVNYENGKIFWKTAEAGRDGVIGSDMPSSTESSGPVIIANFSTPNAKTTKAKKNTKIYGYVTAAKNKKVRTYTSTGKFSKHYVYGHHTYRLSSKKKISKRGTCYKIYGKNQWIPKKYLLIK